MVCFLHYSGMKKNFHDVVKSTGNRENGVLEISGITLMNFLL